MKNDKLMADCAVYSSKLPSYLDYILQGQAFSDSDMIEEHIAICSHCARDYSCLLGFTLHVEIETLKDRFLQRTVMSDYEPAVIDVDSLIEITHHWLFTCQTLDDQAGTTVANSYLGLLHELKKEPDLAEEYHLEALVKVVVGQENYIILNSTVSLGRIYQTIGKWDEAYKYFCCSERAARELQDTYAIAQCLIELGDYYRHRSEDYIDLGSAIINYQEALKQGEEAGHGIIFEIAQDRIKVLKSSLLKLLKDTTLHFFSGSLNRIDEIPHAFYEGLSDRILDYLAKMKSGIPTVSINLDLDPAALQALFYSSTQEEMNRTLSREILLEMKTNIGELNLTDDTVNKFASDLVKALSGKRTFRGDLHFF